MQYSKSMLLYQDKPSYGLFLKLILVMPAAFLFGSLYLYLSGDIPGSLALLPGALSSGLVFWVVFPREYQVYDDHLQIALGYPFSVRVRFQDIKAIRTTNRTGFTINLVTRITRSYVEIEKKSGWSIVITPTNNDLFIENATHALKQWLRTQPEMRLT